MRRIVPLTLIMMLLIISVATSFYQRSANHVSLFHSLLFAKNIIPDPKERVHFAHLTLAKELQNSCKRARPVSAPKGERWGSPHAVQTCLLGVEGAHLFDALLQDFFLTNTVAVVLEQLKKRRLSAPFPKSDQLDSQNYKIPFIIHQHLQSIPLRPMHNRAKIQLQ